MISDTILTKTQQFNTPASALQHINARRQIKHLISTHHLHLSKEGLFSHCGFGHKAFEDIPLTDVAIEQLNNLVGITPAYSKRIDSKLHAVSVNDILKKMEASVTVIVSIDLNNPERQYISAILSGANIGIDNRTILNRLEFWGLRANITLKPGAMQVHFGTPKTLEVLPSDYVNIMGVINNNSWTNKPSSRSSLDVSVYWKRLVCSNGAYLRKNIAKSNLMRLASKSDAEKFIDNQIKRVMAFEENILIPAVNTMSDTMPEEDEHEQIKTLITRKVGKDKAEDILCTSVSWWDHFNAITAAANVTNNDRYVKELQVKGGEMLEQFISS